MSDAHKNFAYGTLLTAPSPATSGTSLVVNSGQGALFPTPPFNATIWPAGTMPVSSNSEIVRVTNISTDTFTITRTQESTSARTVIVGDQIAATITKKTFDDLEVMSAPGDMIYGGTAGTFTRLPVGAANQELLGGTTPAWTSQTGWIADTATWIYGSATQIAVAGDATTYLPLGAKISYNDGSVDYGYVGTRSFLPASPITTISSDVSANTLNKNSHGLANGTAVTITGLVTTTGITNGTIYFVVGTAANTFQLATAIGGSAIDLTGSNDSTVITATGATVVGLVGNDDYSIANTTLSAPRYSYAQQPQGHPIKLAHTPTLSGWSANPTSMVYYILYMNGNLLHGHCRQAVAGTSNAASHTMTMPTNTTGFATTVGWVIMGATQDNNTNQYGFTSVGASGTVINLVGQGSGSTNTSSGVSRYTQGHWEFAVV